MTNFLRISWLSAPLVAISLAVAAPQGPAHAADENGSFAIHGIGALTCSTLTSGLLQGQTALRETLGAWVTGYLSATNRLRDDTYDATPIAQSAALSAMAVNICVANPDALVETAVNSMVDALSVAAATTETPQQEVSAGERSVRVRTGTLRMVQEALVEKGHLSDPADGTFASSTETALRAFQREAGLTETGLPDPATILRLLVGPSVAAAEGETQSGN